MGNNAERISSRHEHKPTSIDSRIFRATMSCNAVLATSQALRFELTEPVMDFVRSNNPNLEEYGVSLRVDAILKQRITEHEDRLRAQTVDTIHRLMDKYPHPGFRRKIAHALLRQRPVTEEDSKDLDTFQVSMLELILLGSLQYNTVRDSTDPSVTLMPVEDAMQLLSGLTVDQLLSPRIRTISDYPRNVRDHFSATCVLNGVNRGEFHSPTIINHRTKTPFGTRLA